jgi:hypothetical protein
MLKLRSCSDLLIGIKVHHSVVTSDQDHEIERQCAAQPRDASIAKIGGGLVLFRNHRTLIEEL